ncbi:hypothetical protein [Limnohabitans sp. B9-3]|uniref:hypothetical protein n=1 Tax=Limnohabitans sp. B9-3 TaxID=1100707 RepID=UPI00117ACAB8|nr:hypothetical protein [Limnohabitans sp. B9-3]
MPTKPTLKPKNIAKGESFTYAFRRINEAIANEYYLEAITLCESIISDRLLSHVSFHKKNKGNLKTSFANLIVSAQKIHKLPIEWKSETDLFKSIDEWRDARNKCVHGAAKSIPTEPTISVLEFIKLTKQSANQGKRLARFICDWHKVNQKEVRND